MNQGGVIFVHKDSVCLFDRAKNCLLDVSLTKIDATQMPSMLSCRALNIGSVILVAQADSVSAGVTWQLQYAVRMPRQVGSEKKELPL